MDGTNPPPSIRTFFQVYGSAAAAVATSGWAATTAVAAPTSTAASAAANLNRLMRGPSIAVRAHGGAPKASSHVTALSSPRNMELGSGHALRDRSRFRPRCPGL